MTTIRLLARAYRTLWPRAAAVMIAGTVALLTAASAVEHACSGALAMPASASTRLASASLGLVAGRTTGGSCGGGSAGFAAKASPNRPMA